MHRARRAPRWGPAWIREWASDSSVLLFSQFAAIVATSALAILIARQLAPHDWGVFSGFLALGLALAVFGEFGMSTWLLRELIVLLPGDGDEADPNTWARAGGVVSNSLLLSLSIVGSAVVASAVAVHFLNLQLGLAVAVIALVAYGGLISASTITEAFFRSRRNLRRIVAATLFEKGLLLALVAAAVAAGFGVVVIALAYLAAGSARLIFNVTNAFLRDRLPFSRPRLGEMLTIFHRSLPFSANRAFLNVVPRADVFLLAIIAPVSAGYFALGDRVVGPALIIPVVASRALYPFLGRDKDHGSELKMVLLFATGGVVVAVIGVFTAPFVVPLLFGSAYTSSVHIVQLMILVIPFVFVSNPLLVHLYSARREGRGLTSALAVIAVAGTAMIVAGQVLIGTAGAASGYVLRQALFVAALSVVAFTRVRLAEDEEEDEAPIGLEPGPEEPLVSARTMSFTPESGSARVEAGGTGRVR